MRIIRKFYPVGHGAFYHECFQNDNNEDIMNVVFDCGQRRSTKCPNVIIDNEFKDKNKVIDAVFISHFDEDHINCLDILLNTAKVSKVYYPIITNEEKQLYSLQNKTVFDDFINSFEDGNRELFPSLEFVEEYASKNNFIKFLLNPENILKEYGVEPEVINNEDNEQLNNPNYLRYNLCADKCALQMININGISDWAYIPFNLAYNTSSNNMIREIIEEFNTTYKTNCRIKEELAERISSLIHENGYKKVSDIYKKVLERKINEYSMTVLSVNLKDIHITKTTIKKGDSNLDVSFINKHIGFLFLGDYNCKNNFKQLKNAYSEFLEKTLIAQIPHHGSSKNYNEELMRFGDIFVVSADGYYMPNKEVLTSMLSFLKYCFQVKKFFNKSEWRNDVLIVDTEFTFDS